MKKRRNNYIRSIHKQANDDRNTAYQYQEFPKDKPGVIYVRQSSLAQVQKNLHSFEMQTDKFVEHFRAMGVTKHIEVIADDEGKSGTLDIHDREGLARVVRLIEGNELINGERIGWVGAVHVNRLTRDPWLIVPGVLMKDCYENDVWIATLRMNFNFQDEYCKRVFMLEAEESARHLKWMKEVLNGGLQVASDKGYYDGRSVLPGYIVDYREYLEGDNKNPNYKKYILYEPHAIVVRWLFQRYLELDGNFPALCREVDAMPYLFPAFEKWVNRKSVGRYSQRKGKIKEGLYEACYKPSWHGLYDILTNPVYIGWWIPRGGGLVESNHEPIVDKVLFTYAHKRLSTHDLNGDRQKPERINRNGKAEVLLKKVVEGLCDNYCVYPQFGRGKARYRSTIYRQLSKGDDFSVEAEIIDTAFSNKFFERLQEWLELGELGEWKERIEQAQINRKGKKDTILKEIKQAKTQRQETMDILDDPDIPKTKQMKIDYAQKVAKLEAKIDELEQKLKSTPEEEEEEEVILYRIWELIPDIQREWLNLTLEERMKVVGAFTRRVILSLPSPGWLKMEIDWKLGQRDMMHIARGTNGRLWAEDEDEIIQQLWPMGDGAEILKRLPTRSYSAIKRRAGQIGVRRVKKGGSIILSDHFDFSWQDKIYADEQRLDISSKNPQWSRTLSIFVNNDEKQGLDISSKNLQNPGQRCERQYRRLERGH